MTVMNNPPTVSVVIPAYNAAWCVQRAIDSVLGQTYTDLEIIVVDDGSTDATPEVLAKFLPDIRIVSQPNGGLPNARNAGIRAAKGTWVAFLDADDHWLQRKLEAQMQLVSSVPELTFCTTAARVESPTGELLNYWRCGHCSGDALQQIFLSNAFVPGSGSAVLARRDTLLMSGGFDESLSSLEDIDMWMRLASNGSYACLDEPLVVICKHPTSMSRNLGVMRKSAIRVMWKNRALLPPNLRGGFWRMAYGRMLCDYAKWAYRNGRHAAAVGDLLRSFALAPIRNGRLSLSLLVAVLTGRTLP